MTLARIGQVRTMAGFYLYVVIAVTNVKVRALIVWDIQDRIVGRTYEWARSDCEPDKLVAE